MGPLTDQLPPRCLEYYSYRYVNLMEKYLVGLLGWTSNVMARFVSSSEMTANEVRAVLPLLRCGQIQFVRVTPAHIAAIRAEQRHLIRIGFLNAEPSRNPRSDIGQRHPRINRPTTGRRSHGPILTPEFVPEGADDDEIEEDVTSESDMDSEDEIEDFSD